MVTLAPLNVGGPELGTDDFWSKSRHYLSPCHRSHRSRPVLIRIVRMMENPRSPRIRIVRMMENPRSPLIRIAQRMESCRILRIGQSHPALILMEALYLDLEYGQWNTVSPL